MEIEPAKSSARPPRMTILEDPREERPAVRAKGTVRPSAKPMMLSRTKIPLRAWCSLWVGPEMGVLEEWELGGPVMGVEDVSELAGLRPFSMSVLRVLAGRKGRRICLKSPGILARAIPTSTQAALVLNRRDILVVDLDADMLNTVVTVPKRSFYIQVLLPVAQHCTKYGKT